MEKISKKIYPNFRNVIIAPHSAFDTREAVQLIPETAVENIKAFIARKAENVVGLSIKNMYC